MKEPKSPITDAEAWSRFERAVETVAKSPPQHRIKKNLAQKPEKKPKKPKVAK